MNILILGGTRFLGRHLVDVAQARGHRLTLFNRGRSAPGLFATVEQLHGDRDSDLAPLHGRAWDAVIDTCGYLPRIVRRSVQAVQDQVDRYLFVSSVSVYAGTPVARLDESAPRERLPAPDCEDIPGHYGALKAACEDEVLARFGERTILLRPGLIVGPFDPTGRFTYWIRRLARGGTVLAPADPAYPVQFIDGRDLAAFAVDLIEQRRHGAFNATGPAIPLDFGEFLHRCRQALHAQADFVWPDVDFLRRMDVAPWTDLPLYAGEEHRGFNEVDIARALSAGLRLRPLAETCLDTARWTEGSAPLDGVGLAAGREAELLAAWRRRNTASVLRRGSARG